MSKRSRARLARERRKVLRAGAPVRKLQAQVARDWGEDTALRAAQRFMPTQFANWERDWNHAAHLNDCVDRLVGVLAECGSDVPALVETAREMALEYQRQLRKLTWPKESRVFVLPKCISRNGERSDLERVRKVRDVPDTPMPSFGN